MNLTDPFQPAPANSEACTFGYDDLARLGSVNCVNGSTNVWNQSFTAPSHSYDAFGNLQKTVPTGGTGITFTPTYSATTNRFSTIPGVTVAYDSDGNLTTDDAHTYAWDSEGRATTVDGAAIYYDAFGREVEIDQGSSYKQIVYGATGAKLQTMNGQTIVTEYVPLPGGGGSLYTQSGQYYRHPDVLGSSRLLTTGTQTNTPYYDGAYAPFGESYAEIGTMDRMFTGQTQDTVQGLYDFTFRRYSPTQGRWVSPDPSGLAAVDMTNPQTWNRYAYVMNNPLSYVDPLGLFCEVNPGGDIRDNFVVRCKQGEAGYNWGAGEFPTYNYEWLPSGGVDTTLDYGFDENGTALFDGQFGYVPGQWEVTGVTISFGYSTYAANNGSWFQRGLNYLKTHPITISVNEFFAGQITYQASTNTICGSVGAGASVPPTKAVTVGILNAGNMQNWQGAISGPSYSFGANLFVGYQGTFSSSGNVGGPTVSGIGLSGSYTIGGCTTIP